MSNQAATPQTAVACRSAQAQSTLPKQVLASEGARTLLRALRAEHGEILIHQSGGCCDGSSPMCYPRSDFIVGDEDVCLGDIDGVPFYISRSQFDYWKHTQLKLDVVPGRGGMFSLENGSGERFHIRSRLFTDVEAAALQAAGRLG